MGIYLTALVVLAVCAAALARLPGVLSTFLGKAKKPTEERKGEGD